MYNKISFSSLLLLIFFNSFSQEGSILNNGYLNPFIINPACTGAEYYPVAHLSVKKQWLGIADSPVTFLLAGNLRIGKYDYYDPKGFLNKGPVKLKDRIGFGAAVFQDINGPLKNTGGVLSYGYHLPINKDSRLSFGLSAIMLHYSLNSSILKPDVINDPYLFTDNDNIFNMNLGTGVYYQSYNYFAGVSVIKVLTGVSSINEPKSVSPSYFLSGGYTFNKTSKSFVFEPSVTLKKPGGSNFFIDGHAKVYIKQFNWAAFSISTSQRINFQFGLKIYKMTYFGYNFESGLGKIARYNYGSHEISLGINLGLRGVDGVRDSRNY
jgi:type IX secretion system PorP/SprF family membrane protein